LSFQSGVASCCAPAIEGDVVDSTAHKPRKERLAFISIAPSDPAQCFKRGGGYVEHQQL
jgi:hypothetical protein